jgi:hypothetical protein
LKIALSYEQLKPFLTTDRARSMSESDLRAVVEDAGRWAAVRPAQFRQWVGRLEDSIECLFREDVRDSDIVLFWICLYGLFDEGVEHYKNLDNLRYLTSHPSHDVQRELDKVRSTLNLIESIGNEFSDEEMIVIEYERHCSAHLFQDAYTLRLDKRGSLLRQKGNLDLREITEKIVANEFKKYESEFQMAQVYARRIAGMVKELARLL